LKRGFPGDPEFALENFCQLPYPYVLSAVNKLNRLNREELHNFEKPITYLSYQTAEVNRDRKRCRKPFKPEDFYYYADQSALNLPEPKYGAAALALIEKGLFPHWALFAYKDLKVRAEDALPPEVLCLSCEDAIILAPSIDGHIVTGMLIAAHSASEEIREMTTPCGKIHEVRLPKIDGKFAADEEAEVRLLR
jgi:hypothetical protein